MSASTKTAADDADTRQRLLDTAGAVFSEVGYKSATIREICRRAGANVAAIHYHFRDKDGLYRAVLQGAFREAEARAPLLVSRARGPEAELREFVGGFLRRLYGDGSPAWLMRLMSREMFEPTDALDDLVRVAHRPTFDRLLVVVRGVGRGRLTRADAERCTQAVLAQCVFYAHARAVLSRMNQRAPGNRAEIDELADRIARFSSAGIKDAARERKGSRAR